MADFIEWTDNLVLDFQEIDERHRRLVALLNRLAKVAQLKMGAAFYSNPLPSKRTTTSGGVPDTEVGPNSTDSYIHQLLDEFLRHTQEHFQGEEALMEAYHYGDLPEHKREHTMLFAELKLFVRDIKKGVERLDKKALCELKHWLIVHIRKSDKAFADYVNSAGTQYILPFHLQANY